MTSTQGIQFGYLLAGQFLPGDNAEVRLNESLEQVRAAREAGFHSIWVTQHFLSEFQYLQPIPFLARLLPEVGRMHIGTCVMLATLYPPVLLAEEIATLDSLCGGRFIFGAGTGYRDIEFKAFGISRSERMEMFDEVIHIMRSLWSGQVVDHMGKHYQLEGAQLQLVPPQGDAIPIWVGATGRKGIEHAASAGDEWLISPELSAATIKEMREIYRSALPRQIDGDTKIYPMLRETFVAKDHEEAQKIASRALRTKYEAYARWGHDVGRFQELLDSTFMLGSIEDCIADVEEYSRQFGTRFLVTRMQWPGLLHSEVLRSIERFGAVIEHWRT